MCGFWIINLNILNSWKTIKNITKIDSTSVLLYISANIIIIQNINNILGFSHNTNLPVICTAGEILLNKLKNSIFIENHKHLNKHEENVAPIQIDCVQQHSNMYRKHPIDAIYVFSVKLTNSQNPKVKKILISIAIRYFLGFQKLI